MNKEVTKGYLPGHQKGRMIIIIITHRRHHEMSHARNWIILQQMHMDNRGVQVAPDGSLSLDIQRQAEK